MFKIYDEPESPKERACFKIHDDPELPNGGGVFKTYDDAESVRMGRSKSWLQKTWDCPQ